MDNAIVIYEEHWKRWQHDSRKQTRPPAPQKQLMSNESRNNPNESTSLTLVSTKAVHIRTPYSYNECDKTSRHPLTQTEMACFTWIMKQQCETFPARTHFISAMLQGQSQSEVNKHSAQSFRPKGLLVLMAIQLCMKMKQDESILRVNVPQSYTFVEKLEDEYGTSLHIACSRLWLLQNGITDMLHRWYLSAWQGLSLPCPKVKKAYGNSEVKDNDTIIPTYRHNPRTPLLHPAETDRTPPPGNPTDHRVVIGKPTGHQLLVNLLTTATR